MSTSDKASSRRQPETEARLQLRSARAWLECLADSLKLDRDRTAMLFPTEMPPGRQIVDVEVTIAQRGDGADDPGDMGGRRVTLAHSIEQIDATLAERDVLAVADTQTLAEAFCTWPLPASVCSDPCATMPGYPNRSGTNLITVAEAKAMFDHLVERGLLATAAQYRPISELRDGTIGPVIFWNNCNGPFYENLVLPEEAQDWREKEIFTHFILLESDPEEREALSVSATDVRLSSDEEAR